MLEAILKAIEQIKNDIETDPSDTSNDLLVAVQYDLSMIQEKIRKGSSGLEFENFIEEGEE